MVPAWGVMRNWPIKRERRARIEIIPMIDVMMFLLVFFVLISINVLPALGLKITPPTSGNPDKIVERTRLTVGIDRDGRTFLDGQPIEIADLPERQRLALSLVYFEGLTNIEAAAVLEVSVDALESLLARARRGLKDSLSAEWRELLGGLAETGQ